MSRVQPWDVCTHCGWLDTHHGELNKRCPPETNLHTTFTPCAERDPLSTANPMSSKLNSVDTSGAPVQETENAIQIPSVDPVERDDKNTVIADVVHVGAAKFPAANLDDILIDPEFPSSDTGTGVPDYPEHVRKFLAAHRRIEATYPNLNVPKDVAVVFWFEDSRREITRHVATLEKRLAEVESELELKSMFLDGLDENYTKRTAKCGDLTRKNSELHDHIAALEQRLAESQGDVVVLNQRLTDTIEDRNAYATTSADRLGRLFDLTAQLDTVKQKLEVSERMYGIYYDIMLERGHQDQQWGGAEHDDEHSAADWRSFRARFEQRVADMLDSPHDGVYELTDGRNALIKIAALAVAQIESLDRSVHLPTEGEV